jgi:DNA (cytosine-5)-methyltransferase 1
MKRFNFIDLFCGIGGFRQAMECVGGTCVFSSDKNKNARLTYEANYGEIPAGDITKIDVKDIPEFDVLCGGFPCQPFSIAGKQRGFHDTRGTLFFEIAQIIEYQKPKVVFLENVANLARHDDGNTLAVIVNTLQHLGYDVHYKVLSASDYGVAQIRKRIYIVCFRHDLHIDFNFPEPTNEDVAVEDFLDSNVDEHYYIDPDTVHLYKDDIDTRISKTYRIGYIGEPRNSGAIGQGQRIYSLKGHASTFVVSSRGPAGGTEAYYINDRVRKLTPNEAKRIMGFPEDFIFPVSESRSYELLGNSVAVPVIKAITHQILASGIFDAQGRVGDSL